MEKKNTLLLTVIAVATLLVAVVGATFAYFGSFTTTVDNKAGVNVTTAAAKTSSFTTTAADLKLNVAASDMLKGSGAAVNVGTYAGDNSTLTVTLTADDPTTTTTCAYSIYFQYDAGSKVYGAGETPVTEGTENKEFTYTLTPSEGITVEEAYAATTEKDFSVFKNAASAKVLVAKGSISARNTTTAQTLAAKVIFYNFPTINQTALADKSFAGKFFVDNEENSDTKVVCSTTAD